MRVPTDPWAMMARIYREVIPQAHRRLRSWKAKADLIPSPELRRQALASIETKTFHCEGGAIYGLLAQAHVEPTIRFIVAYQTISDYLDNLCDRSVSLDPADFRALHQALLDALTPGAVGGDYYRYREEQADDGYLAALVAACQDVLCSAPGYPTIAPTLHELANYYCDLQVHKHVRVEERVPRLQSWFEQHRHKFAQMRWFEFSACAGSTLGIFCLVAYAFHEDCSEELAHRVKNGYFPWLQGLHILLDYFIDQDEDRQGGDLNFCFYYKSSEELAGRFAHFKREADRSLFQLPNVAFHRMISQGLLGVYLADKKVMKQKQVRKTAGRIIRLGGGSTVLFYLHALLMSRLRQFA